MAGDTRLHRYELRRGGINRELLLILTAKSNMPNRTEHLNWSAVQVNIILDKIPYTGAIESFSDFHLKKVKCHCYILIICIMTLQRR